jgi:hypothetical protein
MQRYGGKAMEEIVLRWLRPWRERDDRSLVKPVAQSPDVDPVEEPIRIIGEAQDRDAADEARLDHLMRGDRPSSYQRRRPHRR